jgi:hypothetical protein
MTAPPTLWLLLAMITHSQGRHAPVKLAMPVPETEWRTVVAPSISPSTLTEVKRAASAAHIAGEARVHAAAGTLPPEMLLALGANKLLFPPTARPVGKEDEFLARACWFNGQGRPVRQILLLESRLAEPSVAVMEALLAGQRDFDVVDAARLLDNNSPNSPQLDGENLQLGEGHYGVILVAPSDAWPEETLDLLQEFITARGKVIFLGRQPLAIQRLLLRTGVVRVGESIEDIDRGLNYAITRDFHVADATSGEAMPMIRYQHRTDGRRHFFLIFNADREHAASVRMGIGSIGPMEEWDLSTGLITPLHLPVKEIPARGTLAVVVTQAVK